MPIGCSNRNTVIEILMEAHLNWCNDSKSWPGNIRVIFKKFIYLHEPLLDSLWKQNL